ncbi:SDR family NAD(P)-dependent oxidoreductase [Hoyosella rhizosphaerae]|uniref:Short-chain type dehydrogenase/reductase n=1 Tax=Hoyosella rhizosphaerae TaxID=1755582 RepID=A0A916XGN4_9ACTN|nr:SDR family NAD(P)-dependent oxidoreductase [Hoyosella rhizosphaerae]MBN4927877.1 SDR family NAD(P)-dependent oxidoreductase [Hoyosella rhizosphaerae]GGC70658.1 short-chain type dehydrogenase/reductase [Hoyosella rhizosphaerae]
MKNFNGKTAVITGAGSGIGRALALQLAKEGAQLALSDVNTVGLDETARQARELGASVHTAPLNVAEREAVLAYADDVAAHFGAINMVFNNAGIAFTGDVEVSEFKDIERIMDVDFWGVVNGTKAFLPHLIASGDGHVINISSLFGLVAIPSQSAYNAAKFAVRGFTEALRMEMLTNGHPVSVTCVHPGGIKTAIARTATAAEGTDAASLGEFFDKHLARTSPEAAANRILRDVKRNRARCLIGLDARMLDIFQRVSGSGYQRIFASTAGRIMKKAGTSK